MVDPVVVYDASAVCLALLNESNGILFEIVLPDEGDGRPDTWNDEKDDQYGTYSLCPSSRRLIIVFCLPESEVLYADVCGEHYEQTVDEEKIQCSEKVAQVAACQPESCRTKRRHQCSGYGHSGEDGPLLLPALLQNTCESSE